MLLLLFICFLLLAACQSKSESEIAFNDRTQGWQVELPYALDYFFLDYNPGKADTPREMLFDNILSSDGKRVYDVEGKNLSSEEYREQLLRDCYGSRYIDLGHGKVNIMDTKGETVSACWNDDVLILQDRNTGEIICLDTRLHPELELDYVYFGFFDWMKTNPEPVLRYTFNLAECDASYLCWLNDNICGFYDREKEKNYYYEVNKDELPLDARGAYELARISCEEEGKMGPAMLAKIDGDFYVYYAEKPDAYIIISDVFAEIIAREDGELLFLSKYSFMNGKDGSTSLEGKAGKTR